MSGILDPRILPFRLIVSSEQIIIYSIVYKNLDWSAIDYIDRYSTAWSRQQYISDITLVCVIGGEGETCENIKICGDSRWSHSQPI